MVDDLEHEPPILFGRKDLSDFYRKARETFFEINLAKIYQFNHTDQWKELIICNMWKVVIYIDDQVKFYSFDVVGSKWIEGTYSVLPR